MSEGWWVLLMFVALPLTLILCSVAFALAQNSQKCRHGGTYARCTGYPRRMCMDRLCVEHCKHYHGDKCGL